MNTTIVKIDDEQTNEIHQNYMVKEYINKVENKNLITHLVPAFGIRQDR